MRSVFTCCAPREQGSSPYLNPTEVPRPVSRGSMRSGHARSAFVPLDVLPSCRSGRFPTVCEVESPQHIQFANQDGAKPNTDLNTEELVDPQIDAERAALKQHRQKATEYKPHPPSSDISTVRDFADVSELVEQEKPYSPPAPTRCPPQERDDAMIGKIHYDELPFRPKVKSVEGDDVLENITNNRGNASSRLDKQKSGSFGRKAGAGLDLGLGGADGDEVGCGSD